MGMGFSFLLCEFSSLSWGFSSQFWVFLSLLFQQMSISPKEGVIELRKTMATNLGDILTHFKRGIS